MATVSASNRRWLSYPILSHPILSYPILSFSVHRVSSKYEVIESENALAFDQT